MHWQYSPYLLPLIGSTAVTVALALFAWQRRFARRAVPFALLMLAAAEWSLAYMLELGSTDLSTKVFWGRVQFLGSSIVPVAFLAFTLQCTRRQDWLTRRNLALLAIEPLVTNLLVWTNDLHGWVWSDPRLAISGPFSVLVPVAGGWAVIDTVYSYSLLVLAIFLLVQEFIRSPKWYRRQIQTVLIGVSLPLAADAFSISLWNPLPGFEWAPFAFSLAGLVMAWGLFRFRLLDVLPVARQAIIGSMADGVIVLDTENRIVDLNPAAEQVFGCVASDVIGQPIDRALAAWYKGPSGSLSRSSLGDGHSVERSIESPAEGLKALTERHLGVIKTQAEIVSSLNGTPRHFDVRLSPLTDRDGGIVGRLIVLHDITELKRAEETLSLARDQALEASRLKSELLANVSHDLCTPLNAILGYADMLQSAVYGPLSDKQSQMAERIIANTRQLSSLINNLLDQAQAEAGKLELKLAPFAPADLVGEVVAMMGAQAQAKGLMLTHEIADDVPDVLSGDLQRLRQILANLLSNAIKFTAQGAVHVRIYRPATMLWALQVSDTGCGIPEDAHHYIFEPFRQVDGSATREHKGIGLGLSLVKRLVTSMGGGIELESKVGQGSTFTVVLPLTLPQEEEKKP